MMTQTKGSYTDSNTKPGDLVGFNVTCTAANGCVEQHTLRASAGLTMRQVLDGLRNIDDSYTARGWTVTLEQVEAKAA